MFFDLDNVKGWVVFRTDSSGASYEYLEVLKDGGDSYISHMAPQQLLSHVTIFADFKDAAEMVTKFQDRWPESKLLITPYYGVLPKLGPDPLKKDTNVEKRVGDARDQILAVMSTLKGIVEDLDTEILGERDAYSEVTEVLQLLEMVQRKLDIF